jgi:ribosome-interacting GTPase 1
MPTNLPPEYFEAEKRYKEAGTPSEKIAALEELIATIPKHKGTDKLRADFRRRLSKLREEAVKKKKSGKGDLYTVEREGSAQIALVGLANSGKSSILADLSHAHPIIAEYPMATVMPLSGMMPFEDIQFQLVDLPPIGNESMDGWISGILRNADMFLIVLDLSQDPDIQAELLLDQLDRWRICTYKKGETAKKDDHIKYKRILLVANKNDLDPDHKALNNLQNHYEGEYHIKAVSAATKDGMEALRQTIFEVSGIIRVYTKEPGKEPDLGTPFTLPAGSTIIELAENIHKDFINKLRFACVWGSSKFPGQKMHRDHILHDKDIIEFHL